MKKRTSVYIDEALLDFAKKEGINLSNLLEEAIKSCRNGKKLAERVTRNHQVAGSNPAHGLSIFEIRIKAGCIWSFMALMDFSTKEEIFETFCFSQS
ncbi:MAG: type II toxin-antitoxin system CcdA family antitoxin [Archaeoglobaceae archaeon]